MMRSGESLCGMLERRFIQELVRATAHSSNEEERERNLYALHDLVTHADPTLDPSLLDPWTRAFLDRSGLIAWGYEPIALFPELPAT